MKTRDVVRRNIETLLREAGQTQGDLAKGMRIDQANVSRKMSASATAARITLDDLDKIAAHFNVTPAALVRPGCKLPSSVITKIKGQLAMDVEL